MTYTPDPSFSGTARFAYSVCDDGTSGAVPDPKCATGTVEVTVAADRPPTAPALRGSEPGSGRCPYNTTGALSGQVREAPS